MSLLASSSLVGPCPETATGELQQRATEGDTHARRARKRKMPRGTEPETPLSEKEKLQLKQRGDNLRRRQGIGSLKYAQFYFENRRSYPFTRKTYPVLGGRVEASNEQWDGLDPETGEIADWLKSEDFLTTRGSSRGLERRLTHDDPDVPTGYPFPLLKRLRSCAHGEEADYANGGSSPKMSAAATTSDSMEDSLEKSTPSDDSEGDERRTFSRDLKVLMDALRRIPTPRRAALAIEGMLSKPEVQFALEKFGTGSELGLTRKELAAVAVLQNAVQYKTR